MTTLGFFQGQSELSYNEPKLNMESQGSDRSRTRALHR